MQNFELTFIYPTDGSLNRSQSRPIPIEADSLEHAKNLATELIDNESRGHRTVSVAVLTESKDDVMEITRWLRNGGWMDV
ncbi:hypothetical protein AB0O52_11480 [Arthrobacter sp. NPDC080073]|uniref:hypothetical protein n=1 Tax=Arthrobacter sp. NPDC080073 TaxID=3155919 RepID=UPI003417041D